MRGHFGEDGERVVGIAAEVPHGLLERRARLAQRHAVRRALAFERLAGLGHRALAHHRRADDERRLLRLGDRPGERGADRGGVVAGDRLGAPAPGLVLLRGVLARDVAARVRQLDPVRVVEHDHVGQAEMAGDAPGRLGDLLLDAAVGDVDERLVRQPLAEPRGQESLGDRRADGHGVPLAERAGRVLDAAQDVALGVARRRAVPLPERLEFVGGVVAGQVEDGVEQRRHVAGIQEEAVAVGPRHVVRVVDEEVGEEHVDEVRSAHGAARVAGLRLLHHGRRQDPDVVGALRREQFSHRSASSFNRAAFGRGWRDSTTGGGHFGSPILRRRESRQFPTASPARCCRTR